MTAGGLITLAEWWLYIGAAVSAVFLTIGIDRIDEDARGAYVFRPLLIPGVLLIWPVVLWRWYKLEMGQEDWANRYRPARSTHGKWWLIFGVIIPLIFVGAMVLRQSWPADFEPQRLEPPSEARQ